MSNKTTIIMKLYADLSEAEKNEIKTQIRNYDGLGSFEKGQRSTDLNESFKRITGPVSQNSCPVCGR